MLLSTPSVSIVKSFVPKLAKSIPSLQNSSMSNAQAGVSTIVPELKLLSIPISLAISLAFLNSLTVITNGIITVTDMVLAFRRTNSNVPLEKVISANLFTVHEDDDVLKSVKMMHEKKIGSVIVTKHNSPFGIFTERDLLVNVLSYGADLKNPVSDKICGRAVLIP